MLLLKFLKDNCQENQKYSFCSLAIICHLVFTFR